MLNILIKKHDENKNNENIKKSILPTIWSQICLIIVLSKKLYMNALSFVYPILELNPILGPVYLRERIRSIG